MVAGFTRPSSSSSSSNEDSSVPNFETVSTSPITPSTEESGSLTALKKQKTVSPKISTQKSCSKSRQRDRKLKPRSSKARDVAKCVGYYVDALDKKMLWGEAKIIRCNLSTQKIKVHFVGWSKNYDLWTDAMSITAHGRYAPRTKENSLKSWDGDMHLFEDMLGMIEVATFTPVPALAENKEQVTSQPTTSIKRVGERKIMVNKVEAHYDDRLVLKRKSGVAVGEKTSSKRLLSTTKKVVERKGSQQETSAHSLKHEVVVVRKKEKATKEQEPLRISKRHTGEKQPSNRSKIAKANVAKTKQAISPEMLPMFSNLEFDDGSVMDFSFQREKARVKQEAMQSFLDNCSVIWKNQLSALHVQ
ncbi:hypothetical protein PsorP6_003907 [Peronosclerospora sorghi]|uniref:Uncharacterized protein n=1 Tax=Peronosclerospora sorghi TaxID=230839 RepID=A0ACC0VKT6_9STRA|nr:hypothetical protein PsorP6_003907 [Peronosclerospora sorghi]